MNLWFLCNGLQSIIALIGFDTSIVINLASGSPFMVVSISLLTCSPHFIFFLILFIFWHKEMFQIYLVLSWCSFGIGYFSKDTWFPLSEEWYLEPRTLAVGALIAIGVVLLLDPFNIKSWGICTYKTWWVPIGIYNSNPTLQIPPHFPLFNIEISIFHM